MRRRSADSRLRRFQAMWADELAGAATYRALAERADDRRRPIFLELAEAEESHAAYWEARLRKAGITDLRPPRTPFRALVLRWVARWFGIDAVLPLVLRAESADAEKYREVDEAPSSMAEQEQAHGATVAAMRGGGPGGRIATGEARHRRSAGGALRASVFGVSDGLVSNFSLIMGVAGGTSEGSIVLLAGVAGLVAGACSMGAGEWVSVRSQVELYEHELSIEREELAAFPEEERRELELIYRAKGIEPGEAKRIAASIMAQPDVALDTMAREELGLNPESLGSPWVAAGSSFAATAAGAVIPVIPFAVGSGTAAIVTAAALSAAALYVVGSLISVVTGRGPVRTGLRTMLIGGTVATVTFVIGSLVGAAV